MASLVYIHLGRSLPAHLADSIVQTRSFNAETPIFLVAERAAFSTLRIPIEFGITRVELEELGTSDQWEQFRRISRLDRRFRAGFYTLTTERFFVLERIMRALDLRDVIHIENDVMIYFDVAEMNSRLAPLYPNLASTFDNDERCIPGLLYAANADSLRLLLEHINVEVGRRNSHKMNDMRLLGGYRQRRGSAFIDTLPIVPPEYAPRLCSSSGHVPKRPADYSNNFDVLRGLFDAAALGQYLGGIDPRNAPGISTVGFINESCVFDPSACRFTFERDAQGRRYPTLSAGGPSWPVYNLHIHSKALERFAS
jgi:hypothetical protein